MISITTKFPFPMRPTMQLANIDVIHLIAAALFGKDIAFVPDAFLNILVFVQGPEKDLWAF